MTPNVKACEKCLHYRACLMNSEYVPSKCSVFEDEEGYCKLEWISVDEMLPSPYVSVLVYMPDETPHPTVREGFINKRDEWYAGGFDRHNDEVVAWMEMPDPPKMKGGAE